MSRSKGELKREIKVQTEAFRLYFGTNKPLRFDRYQHHTPMIPLVYQPLLEVITEEHYETECIYITREPISFIFLRGVKWSMKQYRAWGWRDFSGIHQRLKMKYFERLAEKEDDFFENGIQ